MSRIYLDHNATTPLDPAVVAAMQPYLTNLFGNPSSVEHQDGHLAAAAITQARAEVAEAIGARDSEMIFTGSCTEANNLAILGAARANPEKRHIITSAIEHPAVLEPARALEREGWRLTILPVDPQGRVSAGDVAASISDETALVSIMAANNEVGTLQPIREIGSLCSARGVLFHTDLAQIMACGDIDVERDNIHLASLSAHKAYGPKGVGALYVRARHPRVKLAPLLFGGGQERGLRPGTLNTASIVGFGTALVIARRRSSNDSARLLAMTEAFRRSILDVFPDALFNGHPDERLPNTLSLSLPGVEPLALMRQLRETISFSASSACASDKVQTSHVLIAMFGENDRAKRAFRIAPGRFTSAHELVQAAEMLTREALALRARNASAAA